LVHSIYHEEFDPGSG